MQLCIDLQLTLIYGGVIVIYTLILFYLFILKNRSRNDLIKNELKNVKTELIKKNFVSNMSHEMRTPLNAIIGFSEQLLKSAQSQENYQFAHNIKNSADHLRHIVNNFVMFSFPDKENIIQEKLPFSLTILAQESLMVFKQKAAEKGIQFFSNINISNDDIVLGDPKLLHQILFNLYDNSIKFTLHGTVKSNFAIIEEDNKMYLHVMISDSGIGISADEINSIFKEFYQIDDTFTRKFGGVGLGLSMCKKLIELQNGEIKVSSNIGVGTVFELKIPYSKPTELQIKYLKNAAQAGEILKLKSFLVVDDDEYNRLLASKRLELWGANVVVCNNGTEALIKLSQQKYDAILLDIHMPDISGIEVAKIIRHQFENINNQTPIMAVTATINNQDFRNVFNDAGINDCLTKPYKENELFEKLTSILLQSTIIDMKENNLVPSIETTNLYDLSELEAIMKGDDEFKLLMLNTFLSNGKQNILNLENSFANNDFKGISAVSHKMLNSYRQFAINSVLEDLEKLEQLRDVTFPNKYDIQKSVEKITTISNIVFTNIEKDILNLVNSSNNT